MTKESSADLASRLETATTPIPDAFFSTLITANHILHHHSVVDGYGHISARSPEDPSIFYLSRAIAPALVSSRAHILAYHVATGEPVQQPASPSSSTDAAEPRPPAHYLERYIHSELYKRFAAIQSVVHAHSEPVIPFSITSVPLRPVYHMGATLGTVVPVFDAALHYSSSSTSASSLASSVPALPSSPLSGGGGARHDLLVSNTALGAALASGFAPTSLLAKTGSALRSLLSPGRSTAAAGEEGAAFPPHQVVLMRGHGFTAVASTVEECVYRAVYTVANARVQRDAVLLQGAWNTAVVAERVSRVGREGYGGGDKEGSTRVEGVRALSEREGREAWEGLRGGVGRPWSLWVREVRALQGGLYRNEFWDEEG